jgi:hypothetical protein
LGETSHTIHGRLKEYFKYARDLAEQMVKHWTNHHTGEGQSEIRFEIVRHCMDSLSRQIGEAVRIEMRGNVLKSQAVYIRCRLLRLVVDKEYMTEKERKLSRSKKR